MNWQVTETSDNDRFSVTKFVTAEHTHNLNILIISPLSSLNLQSPSFHAFVWYKISS